MVSHCSQAAIRAYDEEALLEEACRYLVDEGDYCLAWFAQTTATEDELTTLAQAGTEPFGVRSDQLPPTTGVGLRSPTMRALLEQRPHVVRNIPSNPSLVQRYPDAAPSGYAAICAFPVQFGPHGAGVLTIHSREPDAFAPEEVALLRELAGDMAVGVAGLRARRANDLLEERLELAELRFRSMIENAPIGVFQAGLDGCLVLANQALATMLGYANPNELMSMGAEALPRLLGADDLRRLRQAMTLNETSPPMQVSMRRQDGSRAPVELLVKPANGFTADAVEAFVRDLSGERAAEAIRLAEERQRQEVVRLEELARMRAEFLGRASHELNTPLTPILLQVQALRLPGLDPKLDRGLDLIERNVLRLATLVKDLLAASTLESGPLDFKPRDLDLSKKAAEVVESFQAQAQARGVALRCEGPGPVQALADKATLTQVLYNLVSNAVKFTPRGGTVTVRCDTSEGKARCLVADTGRGFSADQKRHLFAPFGRAHEDLPGDPGGTGLGLFICKGIIEQSGGAVWATSAGPGQGSTFGFNLPLPASPLPLSASPPSPLHALPLPTAPRPASLPVPGRGIRKAKGFGGANEQTPGGVSPDQSVSSENGSKSPEAVTKKSAPVMPRSKPPAG